MSRRPQDVVVYGKKVASVQSIEIFMVFSKGAAGLQSYSPGLIEWLVFSPFFPQDLNIKRREPSNY
jgi:hypothetical protein